MKRPINTKLTKQMLIDMGIQQVYWDFDNNQWWIDRYVYNKRNKVFNHVHIPVTYARCKHKYTQDKIYPKVTFLNDTQYKSYPLARFLYAWFKGDINDGMVVDHIDNNPFNNSLDNLRLVTAKENIEKRYLDNPNMNFNQWEAINKQQKNID